MTVTPKALIFKLYSLGEIDIRAEARYDSYGYDDSVQRSTPG